MRNKALARLATGRNHLQRVEANRLGEWPALTNDHLVTLKAAEARRNVRRNVGVALLVPVEQG